MSKKKQIQRAQQRQRKHQKSTQPVTESRATPRAASETQAERFERARRRRRRRRASVRAAVAGAVLVVAGGVAAAKFTSARAERQAVASMTTGTCRFDRASDPGRVNEHAGNPDFAVDPPSGGVHDPGAAAPGVFAAGSAPGDGQVVHALEHGDIAIWYRPDVERTVVADLEELAASREDDVLLLPRPGLRQAVAGVAWHRRLLCGAAEPEALTTFVQRFADEGPENQPEA